MLFYVVVFWVLRSSPWMKVHDNVNQRRECKRVTFSSCCSFRQHYWCLRCQVVTYFAQNEVRKVKWPRKRVFTLNTRNVLSHINVSLSSFVKELAMHDIRCKSSCRILIEMLFADTLPVDVVVTVTETFDVEFFFTDLTSRGKDHLSWSAWFTSPSPKLGRCCSFSVSLRKED